MGPNFIATDLEPFCCHEAKGLVLHLNRSVLRDYSPGFDDAFRILWPIW